MFRFHYEVWRPIVGYEGFYEVSNYGKIKSFKGKEKYLKVRIHNGYVMVNLSNSGRKGFLVHRLVAEAFLPNPNNFPQVNHKDENKQNNFMYINADGSVDPEKSNLEWCTQRYNTL